MKQITYLRNSILILLILLNGISHAQTFNEITDHGWGGGLVEPKYCVLDITGNGKLDLLAGSGGTILHYEQETPGGNSFLLVTANFNNILVLGFAAPFLYDIDGDGLLDLLVGAADQIWHYEQVAVGSLDFAYITDEFLSSGISNQFDLAPVVVDINNNGLLDLLVGANWDPMLHYEQASPGSYSFNLVSTSFNGIWLDYGGMFTVGHINGNDKLDILKSSLSSIYHYEQMFPSSLNFELITYQFGGFSNFNNPGPFIVDIDNDGLTDLLISDEKGKIAYYRKFQTDLNPYDSNYGMDYIIHAEEDDQTEPDNQHLTESNKDIGLNSSTENRSYGFQLVNSNILESIDVGFHSAPLIIDINNDGLLDMLVGHRHGTIFYYKQTSPGSTQFELITENFAQIEVGLFSSLSPTITDLNGNSKLDLIIGTDNGQLRWYEQTQPGSLEFTFMSNALPGISGASKASPAFADIDNDGLLDVLVGNYHGTITHYKQEVANTHYFTTVTQNFNNIDVGYYSSPFFCDLENDGLLDLLIGNDVGKIYHYQQSEYFSLDFVLVTSDFGNINVGLNAKPVMADINGDGLPDIIVGNELGGLNLFLQDVFLAAIPYNALFSSCIMPVEWSETYFGQASQIWSLSESNFAGGYPCELKASPLDETAISRLRTNYLASEGVGSVAVEFKHYFADAGAGLTAKFQWSSDGESWNDTGWEFNSGGGNIGPETATIELTGIQTDKIRFAFTLDGDHNQFDGWYIDDLWIYTNNTAPSATAPITPAHGEFVFNGTSLIWYEVPGATSYKLYFGTDDPPSNIEEGLIVNSNFYLPEDYLSEGTNYYWKVVPFNSFGDASGCETWAFTVRKLNPPMNLSAEASNADVHLQWNVPEPQYGSMLIADLDPNHSSGPQIQSALASLGFESDYQTSLPANLDAYPAVFVCLGIFSANYILTQPEGALLANYLTNGGNLYLEGGSTWFYNPQTAVHPMFSLFSPGAGQNDLNSLAGIDNTITQGLEFTYSGEKSYTSHLSPTGTGFLILQNNLPVYGVAVANNAQGLYNTIGASFEFGGLDDGQFPNTKQILMAKYLEIFGFNLKAADFSKKASLLGYNVYRSNDGISYTKVNPGIIPDTLFIDLSLPNGTHYYYTKAEYEEGISIASNVEIVEITVGVDEQGLSGFKISPNPATNTLRVETLIPLANAKLTITSMDGRAVLAQPLGGTSTTVDLSNIKAGSYILNIEQNGRLIASEKLVKQ